MIGWIETFSCQSDVSTFYMAWSCRTTSWSKTKDTIWMVMHWPQSVLQTYYILLYRYFIVMYGMYVLANWQVILLTFQRGLRYGFPCSDEFGWSPRGEGQVWFELHRLWRRHQHSLVRGCHVRLNCIHHIRRQHRHGRYNRNLKCVLFVVYWITYYLHPSSSMFIHT